MMTLTAMQKYKTYKWSGNPFFGDIPSCWDIYPLFKIAKIKSIINKQDEELLSVYLDRGVIKFSDVDEKRTNVTSLDLSKYQFVEKGDFVLNNQQAWRGSVGVSNHIGIVSPAYLVLSLSKEINPKYANYLFRDGSMVSQYLICSKGVGTIQRNLYWPHLRRTIVALPSYIEQKQIALLNERKQILIQQAVTQGLDPTVPMKDSGVEWIGKIPEHWIVKRAKYLFNEIDERSVNGDEELLSVSHITGVTPRSEKNVNMFMAEDYSGSKTCEKNDLVFNIMWAWMGALGVSDRRGIVSPSYGVFRAKAESTFNPIFLEYLLKSTNYIEHYNKVSTGLHSSRLRFYGHMFFDMEMGFPSFEEQNYIIEHVQKESDVIDKALSLQEQQIEALKEYKTTLINSAVTGKIKVV